MGKLEVAALRSKLKGRETRVKELQSELEQCQAAPLLDQLSDKRLEKQLLERAKQWREVLSGDVQHARAALSALMIGPIVFAPQKAGYALKGTSAVGSLFERESAPAGAWCREGESNPHTIAGAGF